MQKSLKIGEIEISWLNGGEFELDGGTMFGAVPKALWARKYPADAENYIRLLNTPLLVRTPEALVVIETGLGNKLTERQKNIFRVTRDWSLPEDLAARGISPQDIDYVILTHCDFDHSGGIVTLRENQAELTFPVARHLVQQVEWDDVLHPDIRASHTYWPENFTGLAESGLLDLVEGDRQIVPGVSILHTGGHTRGHQIVRIASQGEVALHLADLFPTHAHFNPLWIMAYDNFPLEVIGLKQKIMTAAVREKAWFTFYHDPFYLACRFDEQGTITDTLPAA